MAKKLITLIFFASLFGNVFSQWSEQGLHHLIVHQLQQKGDTIYACTNDGIYARHFLHSDDPWEPVGLHEKDVTDVFFSDDGRILANVRTQQPWYSSIYIRDDNGFELLAEHESEYIGELFYRMLTATPSLDTIFDLSANRLTYDGGETWHSVFEVNNIFRFVKTDKENPERIWVGGEAMSFTPILIVSDDYMESFEYLPLHNNYFQGDNCTHWIIRNDTTWYVPGEGVIGRSDDGGYTWETLLDVWDGGEMSLYYYDIAFSPADSTIMYVTGDGPEPVPGERLNIIYTTDEGQTWQLEWHQFEEDKNYPVRNLLVMHDEGRDIVFLGADGVYSWENTITGTPGMPRDPFSFEIFPNPASHELSIRFYNPVAKNIAVTVHDLHGRTVMKEHAVNVEPGDQLFRLDISSLREGIYFVTVDSGSGSKTVKLIVR